MMSSNGGRPGMGVLPHSLLEKEIRQIMNQSQLVSSKKGVDNDMTFGGGGKGSTNLRRIANQRLSAMSNYETNGGGGGGSQVNARGSQKFMNHTSHHSGGMNSNDSQVIRHGKVKARQVSSIKNGFKSAEKKVNDSMNST